MVVSALDGAGDVGAGGGDTYGVTNGGHSQKGFGCGTVRTGLEDLLGPPPLL